MIRTLIEAKRYLESLIPLPGQVSPMQLERIAYLCKLLGNPQVRYPIIHVGGTSGKGSTATFTATILTELGLKIGLHLSPHLESVMERIQINNEPISESVFVVLVQHIESIISNSDIKKRFGLPTYFEFLVALSFFYFAQEKVDVAIIEVGLGGTLDGTNIIPPSACILTNVSLDHTAILGKNVAKICKDKMGIIKTGAPYVVSGITQPSLQKMLKKRCRDLDAPLFLLNRDFKLSKTKPHLPGDFQRVNFTLAAECVKHFIEQYFPKLGVKLEDAQHKGAQTAFIPGRFEIVHRQPLVILDGAHNRAKMLALVNSLKHLYPKQKFISIVAVKNDKSIKSMFRLLDTVTHTYVLTTFTVTTDFGKNFVYDPIILATVTTKISILEKNPVTAISQAYKLAQKQHMPILVTGSLFLVGEVRKLWKHG